MKKSRLIGKVNARSQSEIVFGSLSPAVKMHDTHRDPFLGLQRNGSAKLFPASPSGLKLPCISSRSIPNSTKISQTSKPTNSNCYNFETIFRQNRLKAVKSKFSVPKTPYFKARRKNPSMILIDTPKVAYNQVEVKYHDVSFGVNEETALN